MRRRASGKSAFTPSRYITMSSRVSRLLPARWVPATERSGSRRRRPVGGQVSSLLVKRGTAQQRRDSGGGDAGPGLASGNRGPQYSGDGAGLAVGIEVEKVQLDLDRARVEVSQRSAPVGGEAQVAVNQAGVPLHQLDREADGAEPLNGML